MTSATMTITEFLLARIAEDESAVMYAPRDRPRPARDWQYLYPDDMVGVAIERWQTECEAKRRIVGEHSGVDPCDAHDGATMLSIDCDTLLFLAAVYADHPDYDEAWKV